MSYIKNLPPNKANAMIMKPLMSAQSFYNDFKMKGLTAAAIAPIDWRTKKFWS